VDQDIAGVNRAVTPLLVEAAVGSRFKFHPVLLGVSHPRRPGTVRVGPGA
jgi:hypothetical protein